MSDSLRWNSVNHTILVVENLEETRRLLSSWLAGQGFRVVEAESGAEAVEVACREQPSLVFMDIKMPGGDGINAARSIRESAQLHDVPIVAVSADNTEYYQSAARAVGFNAYLVKPVSTVELKTVLDQFLL